MIVNLSRRDATESAKRRLEVYNEEDARIDPNIVWAAIIYWESWPGASTSAESAGAAGAEETGDGWSRSSQLMEFASFQEAALPPCFQCRGLAATRSQPNTCPALCRHRGEAKSGAEQFLVCGFGRIANRVRDVQAGDRRIGQHHAGN